MTATLGIISVTYQHSEAQLMVFINSLLAQTNQDWQCLIIHDGPIDNTMPIHKVMQWLETKPPEVKGKFQFAASPERGNCWGHQNRELGIKFTNTPWVLITNCDNYYTPVFVERVLSKAEGYDMVYCDTLHSHHDYDYQKSFPVIGHMDMGAFIVKTEIAKAVGFPSREFSADGFFIESIKKYRNQDLKYWELPKAYFVHN